MTEEKSEQLKEESVPVVEEIKEIPIVKPVRPLNRLLRLDHSMA